MTGWNRKRSRDGGQKAKGRGVETGLNRVVAAKQSCSANANKSPFLQSASPSRWRRSGRVAEMRMSATPDAVCSQITCVSRSTDPSGKLMLCRFQHPISCSGTVLRPVAVSSASEMLIIPSCPSSLVFFADRRRRSSLAGMATALLCGESCCRADSVRPCAGRALSGGQPEQSCCRASYDNRLESFRSDPKRHVKTMLRS